MDSNAKYSFWKFKKGTNKKTDCKNLWFKKEVILMTDASGHAVAAILFQEGHPIMSRKLTSTEVNYSNFEKEA